MYRIIFYILLFSTISATAQEINIPVTINWEYNSITKKLSIENNSQYIYDEFLHINLNNRVFAVKPELKIYDIRFSEININELQDDIAISDSSYFNIYWAKKREGWQAVVKIKPLLLKNGVHKAVSSFTIKGEVPKHSFSKKTKSALNYKNNSVLSSGNWVKLSISRNGAYKIDYASMQKISSEFGVGIGSIDPRNIAVFGQKGGLLPNKNIDYSSDDLEEIPIEVIGENDGKFDSGDYVIFYADGPEQYKYNNGSKLISRKKNIYTDYTYVFITIKSTTGLRISNKDIVIKTPVYTTSKYNSFAFHEKDEVNFDQSGQQWFGERFEVSPNKAFDFKFPSRNTDKPFTVKTRIGSKPESSATLKVSANNTNLYSYNYYTNSDYKTIDKIGNANSSTKDIKISFNYNNSGKGECLLDYIEINAISNLSALNSQFTFVDFETTNSNITKYSIFNYNSVFRIYNITDPLNPSNIEYSNESGKAIFIEEANQLQHYLLITSNSLLTPEIIGSVENQNLHSNTIVDYIIITNKKLLNSAEKLADFHRNNGLTVNVIDVNKIYNEFSSGRQDIVAIRQYVKMIYEKGGSPSKLKYLLLFGDASYDFKDITDNNTNLVPSFQSIETTNTISHSSSFVCDDFYGFMDSHEGDNITGTDKIDISIGRIPVMTDDEGIDVVNKIINYNSNDTFGDWRNKVQILSDDYKIRDNSDWEIKLMKKSEALTNWLTDIDADYNYQKVHLDTYVLDRSSGRDLYPQAHIDFMQNMQNGNLVTNYFGHGSEVRWTGEGLFDINDINKLTNINNLPLIITITCEFSKFDNPDIYTGGEKAVVYSQGGAIALFSTVREVNESSGGDFNRLLFKYIFPEIHTNRKTLGEILRRAKNDVPSGKTKRIITLLGDPALMLAYPKKDISIKTINYNNVSDKDTIKSLMRVHIDGEVTVNGIKDENFDGIAYPLLFDKKRNLESLDNNNVGEKVPYWMQNNVIYKGKSSVKNGEFSFDFIVPKDINYAYGEGKISIYATSDNGDAVGNKSDIIIGSIDSTSDLDEDGPEISVFMNNNLFKNGGITSNNPVLIVDLEDISGINTVGNGIGHDLKVKLHSIDDENDFEIILNEYYETELDDFTKGKAKYQFLDLPIGRYSAEIIAWDVFNNLSTKSIEFRVTDGSEITISGSNNFPNPTQSETTFSIKHNSPNEDLEIKIEIFNITGQLVKVITHNNNTEGFIVNIEWDTKSDYGTPLKAGTYIYKIIIYTDDKGYSNEEINKLIIIR